MMTATVSEDSRLKSVLMAAGRRWPTAAGLIFGALWALTATTDDSSYEFSGFLSILPLVYVVVAALLWRRWTWPVALVCFGLFMGLGFQDLVEPTIVVLAAALAASIWGTGHGRHRDGDFRLQLIGMVGFGALAVAGLLIDPDLGRYLVAAGWLAHAAWDFVHLARDRVVSRSYAEACGAVDAVVGVGLLMMPLL